MEHKEKMVLVDDRKRTSLAGLARDKDKIFQGSVDADGVITLVPATLVPTVAVKPLLVKAHEIRSASGEYR